MRKFSFLGEVHSPNKTFFLIIDLTVYVYFCLYNYRYTFLKTDNRFNDTKENSLKCLKAEANKHCKLLTTKASVCIISLLFIAAGL